MIKIFSLHTLVYSTVLMSLLFPYTAVRAGDAAQPSGTALPSQVRPGQQITFALKNFASNSALIIADGDKGFKDFVFGANAATNADGTFTKTVTIPAFFDHGTIALAFEDAAHNRVEVPIEIKGSATERLLLATDVSVEHSVRQLHVTGVGWEKNEEKKLFDIDDRTREKNELQFVDVCAQKPCARDDALDLTAVFPPQAIAGHHRITVEQGVISVERQIELPRSDGKKQPAAEKPTITIVNPPVATRDIPSLSIRGQHWGPYRDRESVRAWIIPAQGDGEGAELVVKRNYNDDELFLSVEFSDAAKTLPPGNYLLYVLTNQGVDAVAPFVLTETPDLTKSTQPKISLSPSSGSVGLFVIITAGGFPKRTSGLLRFDGIAIGGVPITDEHGGFDNVSLVIPPFIENPRTKKIIFITPGKHTIEFDTGKGIIGKNTFTVGQSQEDKDAIEKEKKLQEDLKKKEKQLKEEKTKKEKDTQKKKELQNDIQKIKKEQQQHVQEGCLKSAPRYTQSACIKIRKQKMSPTAGKPCEANRAITLQPGCIVPKPPETQKPYQGKACSQDIPLVWQEGCIPQERTLDIPPTAGKPCRGDTAITFQPGCIPQKMAEPEHPYLGKPCDSNLPLVWQEGCVQTKKESAVSSTTPSPQSPGICNPLIPLYSQRGCKTNS